MQTRREMLARSASVAAALAGLGLLPQAAQAAWSQAAFDAKTMGDLMKALGTSGPADALAYGVKVTGATLFVVDRGVDTGPIVAQTVVPVCEGDDVYTLHERIKGAERTMLVDSIGQMARQGFRVEGRHVLIGSAS